MVTDESTTTLEGQIERVTFRNEENHFLIAKFRVPETSRLITVLGHIPDPRAGETLRLKGYWSAHPRYGQQFKVSAFEVLLPSQIEQIRRYLSSGVIKGIGPKMTERLIAHFKDDTLSVIENDALRLAQVKGIGPEKARRISQAWQEHHTVRALMGFLQDLNIRPIYGAKIYKLYGTEAMDILRRDPYRVAQDIPRVGFYIADAIVQKSDQPFDETERAQACIRHLLTEACEEGHVFCPSKQLDERCATGFDLDYDAVQTALAQLQADRQIVVDDTAPDHPVYPESLYTAETDIARRLQTLLTIPVSPTSITPEQIGATIVRRLAVELSEMQWAVLQSALGQRVVIITGGPGTGKTTLIRAMAIILESAGFSCCLAAPTGRAARRMAQVTNRSAFTLHKLLGFNPAEGCFDRDQDSPLETDVVIVDEASMVDLLLMSHLVRALPAGARLILIGDVFQLPSVGPGSVLADLIASQAIPSFELNEVFRQAAQSPIITNAHKVRKGELPMLTSLDIDAPLTEFSFVEVNDFENLTHTILSLCSERLPRQLGVDSIRDIQVLTPVHKGPLGTMELNRRLQAALNPNTDKLNGFGLGDKVMHLRNNYTKGVFNGEIGTVCQLNPEQGSLWVDYEGRKVDYDLADLDELTLAYAISVHKSQGSEYPVVILPLVTRHYIMLQRNLLYTALTRATQMVILIGSAKAVRVAVQTDTPHRRRSLLTWRLDNF